jgi:hypothetical protein
MFNYDANYVKENLEIAVQFSWRFMWRFLLLTLSINILIAGVLLLLLFIINFTIENYSDLYYVGFIYVLSIPTSFFAAYFTFKWLLKSGYKGKRMHINHSLVIVSVGFVWRLFVSSLLIMALDWLIDIIFGSSEFIPQIALSLASVYLAWMWFILLNRKNGGPIEFKSD